ncbi:hypothetical protein CPHO_09370 [Corynebacterium phocae]|uniref:DUF3558 domain-containing protein n=1 Tax=Corynebacterium phocae TaxID=161895 RepID=A0A1L7D4H2_9CORY|nr:DUF3558 family protein [Corynebacterium phocae]APT93059.1 hypothetical protein CPHO_09370 [Corynebacterium phocae]
MVKSVYLAVAVVGAASLLGACGAESTARTEAARAGTIEAVPASTRAVEPSVWDTWSMPELGPFDESLAPDELFQPCRDIPVEVDEALGIEIDRNSPEYLMPVMCFLRVEGWDSKGASLMIGTKPSSLDVWVTVLGLDVEGEIPGFPGAVITRDPQLAPEAGCQALVETVRGTVEVSYFSINPRPSGETFCEVPARILSELFRMDG